MKASIILETNKGSFSTSGIFKDFIGLKDHTRLFIKGLKERRSFIINHVYYHDLESKYYIENAGRKIRGERWI